MGEERTAFQRKNKKATRKGKDRFSAQETKTDKKKNRKEKREKKKKRDRFSAQTGNTK